MSKRSKEAIAARRQALVSAAQTPSYPSVFISYSRKDKAMAKALADDLAAAGVPVWWDREIYPGDDFHNAIVTALDQAQVVIVIWSEDAAASPWVRDEARRAARQRSSSRCTCRASTRLTSRSASATTIRRAPKTATG